MRRLLHDALISLGALAILLILLASIDARVREQVVRIANGAAAGEVADTKIYDVGSVIVTAARDQSVAHAPLAIFVIAAGVLLLCMLRT